MPDVTEADARRLAVAMRERGWSSGAIYGQGLEEAADALDALVGGPDAPGPPEWAPAAGGTQ